MINVLTQNFGTVILETIRNEMNKLKMLDIYEVTAVNESDFTVNIKHPNFKKYVYNNVKISGTGLGNFKGLMKLPSTGDLVLVGFISGTSNEPIIINTIFSESVLSSQAKPLVKDNQLLITNQEKGAYINLDENNNIIVRSVDSIGEKQSLLKLSNDGSLSILNKGGYGFECDKDGNITIRGVTVNYTQTPNV